MTKECAKKIKSGVKDLSEATEALYKEGTLRKEAYDFIYYNLGLIQDNLKQANKKAKERLAYA